MSENEAASHPPPPEPVVDHPAWREALGQLHAAMARPHPIIAMLGPAGTGKTRLLRALLAELGAEGCDVALLARGDAEVQPAAPCSARGIVLVDEADRIDDATLRALAACGARGIILAALPAFAERLDAVPGAAVVPLRALRPGEAGSFIRARMAAAGRPDRLTDDAVAEIVACGDGIPRVLGALATAAEFVASVQSASLVTSEHVREAVSLRGDLAADFATGPGSPGAARGLSSANPGEAGRFRGPHRGERWVGSGGTALAARRRRTGAWAVLGCAAVAALFVAYAARQPAGESLGRRVAMLFRGDPAGAAPAPSPVIPAAAASPAYEVVSNQAAGAIPAAASESLADPAPAPGPNPPAQNPPALGLPHGVVPHVVLSYWQGDGAAERRAAEFARTLRSAGIAANDPVPVLQRIAEPGISYFFAEDRAGAAEVGRALGRGFGEGRAASLQQDAPLPRPGTIELQITSDQPTAERAP